MFSDLNKVVIIPSLLVQQYTFKLTIFDILSGSYIRSNFVRQQELPLQTGECRKGKYLLEQNLHGLTSRQFEQGQC